MSRRKKSTRKKRTITPEHLAKMQEGKKYAKRKREIEADVASLEKRVLKDVGFSARLADSLKREVKH
jgi:hypothetical protein